MVKNIYWLVSGFVLCFLLTITNDWLRFIPGLVSKPVIVTTTNQGNSLKPLTPLATLTNNLTLTNKLTISNIILLFTDDSNFRSMPFVFAQSNENLMVTLYSRSSGYRIQQWSYKPNLISALWNPLRKSYGVSYQRKLLFDLYGGVYADTATNFGVIATWNW